MRRLLLLILLGIGIVSSSVYLYANPVIKNLLTDVLPALKKASNPSTNLAEKKSGNEKGKILTVKHLETFSFPKVVQYTQYFYATSKQYVQPKYEVDHYTITYNTTDENGVLLANSAQLYIPKTSNAESFPLYIFGSGTTGIDDHCAPSKEIVENDNWGDYRAHMISYAAQGYIVLFPDYEGFNDVGRLHHYFVADLEAKVLLDGARAVFDFFAKEDIPIHPKDAVFFAGYSQGGHAAFAAKDIAPSYAPELPVKGIISYGGTMNIKNLLLENPDLAPYLIVAYKDLYGESLFNPSELLASSIVTTLEKDTKNKCVSEIYNYYPNDRTKMFTQRFQKALESNFISDFSNIKQIFDKNNTGLVGNNIPAFVVQGGIDPIVTNESQDAFVKASCKAGNTITYKIYPGVHHFQSRQVSFQDSLAWMKARVENIAPTNTCT